MSVAHATVEKNVTFTIEHLTFAYSANAKPVLFDFSMVVKPATMVAVMGETTSAFDAETERAFLKDLKSEIGDRTVLFITHHEEIVAFYDYQYNL